MRLYRILVTSYDSNGEEDAYQVYLSVAPSKKVVNSDIKLITENIRVVTDKFLKFEIEYLGKAEKSALYNFDGTIL